MFPLTSGWLLRFHVCFQKYPLTPTSSPVSHGATRAGTFRMVLPLLALFSCRYDIRLSFCSCCTWKRGCYQRDNKLALWFGSSDGQSGNSERIFRREKLAAAGAEMQHLHTPVPENEFKATFGLKCCHHYCCCVITVSNDIFIFPATSNILSLPCTHTCTLFTQKYILHHHICIWTGMRLVFCLFAFNVSCC